jgi:hypothetical protein
MTLALTLAGLLARAPAPTDAPGAADTPSPPPMVRRGVDTAPRLTPGTITIRNTGSTNFAGYTIAVHPSGDADVTVGGVTTPATLPVAQTKWLFQKVRGATPLDQLPGGSCLKSASFGSSTTISYGGATSPDITCGADPVVRELARTVSVIVTRLGVHPQRPLRPQPP